MDVSYFFTQFAAYNTDWPVANVILWMLLVVATVLIFLKPGDERFQTLVKSVLALVFFWNGIVFFFFYMTISSVAGGIPMIITGVLFAADIVRKKIRIVIPDSGWLRYITLAWAAWALGLYTIAGWLTGHIYPKGPLPPAPCPTTILAIALLMTSLATLKNDRFPFTLQCASILWWAFFAGIFAPALYGFFLDLTLLAAGVYGLALIAMNWDRANPFG